jgi:hypothetical protein
VATKEHKRFARGLIEGLESRVHVGPPIHTKEIVSAHEFLRQSNFSPASDYFNRLTEIQNRLSLRTSDPARAQAKRNYGGEAAGRWLQVQSIHDHVILSTCYHGEFNLKRGRVKISHRFNAEGRIDFVELKFLRALASWLDGEVRKLILVKDYQSLRKDWHEADAFTLRVLPQELIFLFSDIFRCPKREVLAWLINIGHGMTGDLLSALGSTTSRNGMPSSNGENGQLDLHALRADEVALRILKKAVSLDATVELDDDQTAVVRYRRI